MQRKEFSKADFRDYSMEIVPALNQLQEISEKFGVVDSLTVYISDGYVSVEGSGLCGWKLNKLSTDDDYGIRYECQLDTKEADTE